MKGSDFILVCANLLNYKCHKINLNWVGSCKDSLNWKENGDDKYFQHAATVALNYEEIGKKLTKI